jgi:hypothetical protein
MISEVSVHHSREAMEKSSSHHGEQKAERECLQYLVLSFCLFYSMQAPGLWDDVTYLEGKSYPVLSRNTLTDTPRDVLLQSPRHLPKQSS